MSHYRKLAILGFRTLGTMMLLYCVPLTIYAIYRIGGLPDTPERHERSTAAVGWVLYALIGVCFIVLSRPLGVFAARGLAPSPEMTGDEPAR